LSHHGCVVTCLLPPLLLLLLLLLLPAAPRQARKEGGCQGQGVRATASEKPVGVGVT
jgi:hypothetical protein